MDQLNDYRATRISEVFSDFISLQHLIASAPIEPSPSETCYPKGWLVLRQSLLDGRHVLECAADTTVPSEQNKEDLKRVELRRILLDAYSRRHIALKIYMRQVRAQNWMAHWQRGLHEGSAKQFVQSELQAFDDQFQSVSRAVY